MENGTRTVNTFHIENGCNKAEVYKGPYAHLNKRPIMSVGGASSQNAATTVLDGGRQPIVASQTMPSPQQIRVQQNHGSPQLSTHHVFNSPGKMVVQLQPDTKVLGAAGGGGSLVMVNSAGLAQGQVSGSLQHSPLLQGGIQGGIQGDMQEGEPGSHGYHPARHLQHQLQLKHLPNQQPVVTQISSAPHILQPRQGQVTFQQRSPGAPVPQQYQRAPTTQAGFPRSPQSFDTRPATYTRTYPQTNQQLFLSNNFSSSQQRPRLLLQNQFLGQQLAPVRASPPPQQQPQQRQPQQQQSKFYVARQLQPAQQGSLQSSQQGTMQPAQQGNLQPSTVQLQNQPAGRLMVSLQQHPPRPSLQQQPPRPFTFQTHAVASTSSQAVRTERLSHFDYPGEEEEPKARYLAGSQVQASSSVIVSRYNTVQFRQPAQVIGPIRQAVTMVTGPNRQAVTMVTGPIRQPVTMVTESRGQFRQEVPTQPHIIRGNIGVRPVNGNIRAQIVTTRPPNIVASSAGNNRADIRPVILTAQQAGQTFQSSGPVLVQINGGKSIRGNIVSLQQQQQGATTNISSQQYVANNISSQLQQRAANNISAQQPQLRTANSAHVPQVYFTVPAGQTGTVPAKFIRQPDGSLRPMNGAILQNNFNQSKMYTVRYVTPNAPKTEEGKTKPQNFTVYSHILPSSNNVQVQTAPNTKTEKVLSPASPSEPARKRKPTGPGNLQPSKVSRIEPKPSPSPYSELLQRVTKSLEVDREVVLAPDCTKPFESLPDTFRKLMKYHIYYEPDLKESYLKRSDKLHEGISQKLLKRKDNLINKFNRLLLKEAIEEVPAYHVNGDKYTMLKEMVREERELLTRTKEDLKSARDSQAKVDAREAALERAPSPNPDGFNGG